jgi:hypothetical protein
MDRVVRDTETRFSRAGLDTGTAFIQGFARSLRQLNGTLLALGLDRLELDVDVDDARQQVRSLEFELRELASSTTRPEVRIDANRALGDLRGISRKLRDELGEDVLRQTEKVRKELEKIDRLPSGRAFRFWALTALADMTRVFNETERGERVFGRLRAAMGTLGGSSGSSFARSFISSFDNLSEASSRFLQRLGRVSGELYRMPGVIAVLVSSLPALIAGLGALGGGALGLVSALGSLSGFLAAGPGLIATFAGSIGAMGVVVSTVSEAFEAMTKAQEQEAIAAEQARLGTEKALTPQQKANALLRELAPNTRKVTEGIFELRDEWAALQETVGERFFTQVVNDFDELRRIIPVANNFLAQSAEAMGKIADQGIRMLASGPWRRDFKTLAKENANTIDDMGQAGLSLANVFRNIAIAAIPFTRWVTQSIRDGAEAFADWSAEARSTGSIQAFLAETTETGQVLWQVLKNLGSTINSFFASTVDEGQSYLRTLESITAHWADVAEAQESANSPLRQWMESIRPLLSSMGDLIRDLGRGIGDLASNQSNIDTMIALLDSLRTDVLPPILRIIQQLNDSGIAVTVVEAFGGFLEAISDFLESGAATAISVFVTVLASFAEVIFSLASLPVISDFLGGLAAALATLAAVSIVARFTGLFKLWDFFTWMSRNRGNLSGAFADAARGVAGLQTTGQSNLPNRIPTPLGGVDGGAGRATEATGNAASRATPQVVGFSRALNGVRSAGSLARGALSGLTSLLGGPWGLALIGATVAAGALIGKLNDQKQEARDTKEAFLALKNAYGDLSQGNTENVNNLAETNEKFRDIAGNAAQYGLTLRTVSGALNNQEQDLNRVNSVLDAQIANLERLRIAAFDAGGPTAALPFREQRIEAQKFKDSINEVANAQDTQTKVLERASSMSLTYQERLAGMTQGQVDNSVAIGEVQSRITTLSNALDVMSSATSTAADRSRALRDIINQEKGVLISANEASETWQSSLLTLRDAVESNGKSLSRKTREGLRNRDALQAAAQATRELYLQDIASGVPMEEATKRHRDRIKELQKEADKAFGTNKETKKLIDTYGDVPEDVATNLKVTNYAAVWQQMQDLKALQASLQSGKSLTEAQREVEQNKAQAGMKGWGDGYGIPGFKNGGPVWGAGTRTSDSIQAWLSNGEFVQPTDAVEYYGMPIMEAIRTRKLDRAAISEALPDDNMVNFKSGGAVHSGKCVACATGGHHFARGGAVWPFPTTVGNTLIDKDWATNMGGLGEGSGSGGWRWQMTVLRKQFPGLPLISGYRPNSRTLSGNRSYHALGRAVDLHPSREVAAWIRANYGSRTKELITPFQDLNLHNGKPHRYTGAVWNQHNWAGGNAHLHWAFRQGGLVDLMNMMNIGGGLPSMNTPLPSTPRSLSPAASSVVNNSTDNGTTFGDIIINNPAPERGGDSIRNALYRTQLLF